MAVAGVLVLTVLAHNWMPTDFSHLRQQLFSALHAPGFAAITIALFLVASRTHATGKPLLIAGITSTLIAALSELSQILSPRNAEVGDLVADFGGIAAGLGAIYIVTRTTHSRSRPVISALVTCSTILITLIAFRPVVVTVAAITGQKLAFPGIVSFDHSWERALVEPQRSYQRINPPHNWPTQKGKVAMLNLSELGNNGIHIWALRDWREYKQLGMIVANSTSASTAIEIEVRDLVSQSQTDNWFKKSIIISPIPRKLVIPLHDIQAGPIGRETNLANMAGVVIRAKEPNLPVDIYIDDIRLE